MQIKWYIYFTWYNLIVFSFKIELSIINEKINEEDFHSYTVRSGSCKIKSNIDIIDLNKEETVYTPKGMEYKIHGQIRDS